MLPATPPMLATLCLGKVRPVTVSQSISHASCIYMSIPVLMLPPGASLGTKGCTCKGSISLFKRMLSREFPMMGVVLTSHQHCDADRDTQQQLAAQLTCLAAYAGSLVRVDILRCKTGSSQKNELSASAQAWFRHRMPMLCKSCSMLMGWSWGRRACMSLHLGCAAILPD